MTSTYTGQCRIGFLVVGVLFSFGCLSTESENSPPSQHSKQSERLTWATEITKEDPKQHRLVIFASRNILDKSDIRRSTEVEIEAPFDIQSYRLSTPVDFIDVYQLTVSRLLIVESFDLSIHSDFLNQPVQVSVELISAEGESRLEDREFVITDLKSNASIFYNPLTVVESLYVGDKLPFVIAVDQHTGTTLREPMDEIEIVEARLVDTQFGTSHTLSDIEPNFSQASTTSHGIFQSVERAYISQLPAALGEGLYDFELIIRDATGPIVLPKRRIEID